MKKIFLFLLISTFSFSQDGLPHCGYDFTTYLVANPIDAKTKKVIDSLQITIVDFEGNDLINANNEFSFNDKDKSLNFIKNHKITLANSEQKWYINICNDQYYLQLKNTFLPEEKGYGIKIYDPKNKYKTIVIPIYNNNLYVLCTTQTKKFGPKITNNMITVEM